MGQLNLKVLIIEDDKAFAESLNQHLSNEGITVKMAVTPQIGLQFLSIENFDVVLLDCMLPQKNGVELGQEIKQLYPDVKIVMMSGIFKDSAFANNAKVKTGAEHFLTKPFDISELLEVLQNYSSSSSNNTDIPYFHQFLVSEFNNSEKLRSFLNSKESINGLELPYLLSICMKSSINGDITISSAEGKKTIIKFWKGHILQVQSEDSDSYFGAILISNGFATAEEIDEVLSQESDGRPIGERLVSSNTLSPHAIRITQMEQMSIRLSKLILSQSLELEFSMAKYTEPEFYIDELTFLKSLNDWISSKIKSEWLTAFYNKWSDYDIHPSADLKEQLSHMASVPLIIVNPKLNEELGQPINLGDYYSKNEANPNALKVLYFLMLSESVKLHSDSVVDQQKDFSSVQKRLENLKESFSNKNYYSIFGLEDFAPPVKVEEAYMQFAKVLHPDKLGPEASKDLIALCTEVFQHLTKAKETLTISNTRQAYDEELKSGTAEDIIVSEQLFEKAILNLNNKNYGEAVQNFEEVLQSGHHGDDFYIYYSWAILKSNIPAKEKQITLDKVSDFLMQVPQEVRHTAPYFYAKGLHQKLTGQYDKALSSFKHSFELDKEFKSSRVEYMALLNKKKSEEDKGLLSSIAGIFKSKKAS